MNYQDYYLLFIRGHLDYELIPDINLIFNGACARGHQSFALKLLRQGAEIDNYGYIAVDAAIVNGHYGLVHKLLHNHPEIKSHLLSKYIGLKYAQLPQSIIDVL